MGGMGLVILFFLAIIFASIKKMVDNSEEKSHTAKQQEQKQEHKQEHEQEQVQEQGQSQEPVQERRIPVVNVPFQYLTFKVVGVTFKNGRRSRQTILRQIRFKDPPYSRKPKIRLEQYEYEGEPAFSVWANDEQVGNIGKVDIPRLLDVWEKYDSVTDFSIYGGGEGRSYGIEITVRFTK